MIAGVLIGFSHNPGWRIRDSEVEDFASSDEVIERVHELRDGNRIVPPALKTIRTRNLSMTKRKNGLAY